MLLVRALSVRKLEEMRFQAKVMGAEFKEGDLPPAPFSQNSKKSVKDFIADGGNVEVK
jgi:hypothetical protein